MTLNLSWIRFDREPLFHFQVNISNLKEMVDLTQYVPNGEWHLKEKPVQIRQENYYPNVPEPFPEISITIKLVFNC